MDKTPISVDEIKSLKEKIKCEEEKKKYLVSKVLELEDQIYQTTSSMNHLKSKGGVNYYKCKQHGVKVSLSSGCTILCTEIPVYNVDLSDEELSKIESSSKMI